MEKPAGYDAVLTAPNIMSLLRLLLIPGIVLAYRGGHGTGASVLLILSGITDVADGYVARKWNQVSDLGKILDPVADKLTQAALLYCLIPRYRAMFWLLLLLCIKEMAMGIAGIVVLRRKEIIHSAQWFGKVTTLGLWGVILILFLAPSVSEWLATCLGIICAGLIALSFAGYMRFYFRVLGEN